MPLLCSEEALGATDSFLMSLYGETLFGKWCFMKKQLNFSCEREYISWLMELAESYTNSQVDGGEDETVTVCGNKYDNTPNECEDHADAGQSYDTTSSDAPQDEIVFLSDTYHTGDDQHVYYSNSEATMHCTAPEAAEKKYECHLCHFSTEYKLSLKDHITAVHKKIKSSHCPHCTYSCSTASGLRSHLIYKHGYKTKSSCPFCGKGYQKSKMQLHIKSCTANMQKVTQQLQ